MGDWKWYAALGSFIFMMATIYILLALTCYVRIPNSLGCLPLRSFDLLGRHFPMGRKIEQYFYLLG